MKVLVIIGSLRKKNTYEAVRQFEQIHRAQVDACDYEYLFLKDMNIELCRGCFLCISKGEAKCPLEDELASLIHRIEASDCIILASPNYCRNVNWLTKNLIDRTAYNLHRPVFFDKRFVLIVTSGSFMGAKQAMKALSVIPSGGKIVGKLGIYTAPELSDKQLSKYARRFNRKADRIVKRLGKPFRHNISFMNMFWFASFKATSSKYKASLPADYDYYSEKDYFVETKLRSLHKMIINIATSLMRRIV